MIRIVAFVTEDIVQRNGPQNPGSQSIRQKNPLAHVEGFVQCDPGPFRQIGPAVGRIERGQRETEPKQCNSRWIEPQTGLIRARLRIWHEFAG